MTNNDIFKKLRVALSFKDTDIIDCLERVDYKISKTELSAIFRAEDHPNYQDCGDQLLRNFLNGLIIRNRGVMEKKEKPATEEAAQSGYKKTYTPSQNPINTKNNIQTDNKPAFRRYIPKDKK
jgi:hypothetical protein